MRKPKGRPGSGARPQGRVFNLRLPSKKVIAAARSTLDARRGQMSAFEANKGALTAHFSSAAEADTWTRRRNDAFYPKFRRLWCNALGNRFQANGWERKGKGSDFRELSTSVMRVLHAEPHERDEVVMVEIDRLTELKLPTRRSVFTEMLCQYFPHDYHLDNEPVKAWQSSTGFKSPYGVSAGYRYLECASLLRAALFNAQNGRGGYPLDNLGELDAIICLERAGRLFSLPCRANTS
ncbi:hypothetical protein [Pseudomonas sp. NPDC088444]|uniref:hypothetical protein n=1 Tax=Pseudomonas sp. NPDC088444 TaxID=3364456 RepID=UPI003850D5D6